MVIQRLFTFLSPTEREDQGGVPVAAILLLTGTGGAWGGRRAGGGGLVLLAFQVLHQDGLPLRDTFLLRVLLHQVSHQHRLQETQQHHGKDHDAVGGWGDRPDTKHAYDCGEHFLLALPVSRWKPSDGERGPTYEGSPVGHGGQDLVEDEQQHGDGQQHGDLEAQLVPPVVGDEEGGQVQTQEEEDGQQEVDDMQKGPPLHGDLEGGGKVVKVRGRLTFPTS